MASHDMKCCRANRRWRMATGLSRCATPIAFRFAHMAATCCCRLACDLTCTMVGTFCVPGLNDLNNGRCRYRVTTWTQSTWIRWNHVGSIGLFSQRTSRNVNASAKLRKPCMCMHHWSLHLPAYRRCVKCWQLKSTVLPYPCRKWFPHHVRHSFVNNQLSLGTQNATHVLSACPETQKQLHDLVLVMHSQQTTKFPTMWLRL